MLKKLLTPAGALAMIGGLWLPWADVRCGQIRTEPDYWQLARYDERLFLLLVPILVMLVCGVWIWRRPRRSLAVWSAASALAAVGAWSYLWFRKDEMAALQAQMAAGSNELARMMQDMQVVLGMGFRLYLAGALVALAGAALHLASGESESPPE